MEDSQELVEEWFRIYVRQQCADKDNTHSIPFDPHEEFATSLGIGRRHAKRLDYKIAYLIRVSPIMKDMYDH